MKTLEGWQHAKLTDLAEYTNGYAFKPHDWDEDGLPIVRIEQLRDPGSTEDYFSGHLPDKHIINDGDLIFSWSASLFLRIWQHGKAALNQHLFKVTEKAGVDRMLLKQFIEFYLPDIAKASHGSTMQHITRKELSCFGAMFPTSLAEQTRIGEVLSTVDLAIEQTEALIAKQQRIKIGLIQDLLTRGIDEHGNLRSEETHQFKDSPLGRIPVEWEVKTIGQIFQIQLGKMLSKKAAEGRSPYFYLGNRNGQWDYVDTSELQLMDFDDRERQKFNLSVGDILVCEGGEVGRTCLWRGEVENCYYQKAIHRLRPISQQYVSSLFPRFMRWAVRVGLLSDFTSQTSIAHLTQEKLAIVPIMMPSLPEQSRLDNVVNGLDDDLRNLANQLYKLTSLKTALMQDLLTGKVRVTPLLDKMEVTDG